MSRQYGFTFIELMVTLAVIAITLVLGLPSFSNQIERNRLQSSALSLSEAINTARAIAVMRNGRTVIKATDENWEHGWKIFFDSDDDGELDQDEELIREAPPLDKIKVYANAPVNKYISFIGSGEGRKVGAANIGAAIFGTIRVCLEQSGEGYELALSRGGRLRMATATKEKCTK